MVKLREVPEIICHLVGNKVHIIRWLILSHVDRDRSGQDLPCILGLGY